MSVDNRIKSDEDLCTMEFWELFVAADGDPELRQKMSNGYELKFSRSNLKDVLNDPLDSDSWAQADKKDLTEKIREKVDAINFLRGADMGDLIKHSEFLVKFKKPDTPASEETYKEVAQPLEYVAKALLKPGLAYQLVRAGYINRNFTLYTSTFHGDRVSPAATNFIIHHVERDLMDVHFELGPEDVDAVVRERGKNALKEPALYNIAILDRLLATDVDAADIMICSLVNFGERQKKFLQAYLTAGEQRVQLVQRFTTMSSRVLGYLVSQVELDEASRLELVNTALANLPSSLQRTDATVTDYLRKHYADFSTLIADATTDTQAERVGKLFAEANITLPSLKCISPSARPSFVSRNLYEITHENLAVAIGNEETIALDVIRASDKTIYDYVLEHVDAYLDAVEDSSTTIETSEQFIEVLEDLLEQEEPHLADVVERAAPVCQVDDLGDISEEAWPTLGIHQRFPATFNNVSLYIAAYGVDDHLVSLLAKVGTITETASVDEDEKTKMATTILAAREHLPTASLRVELVASLKLDYYLNIEEIAAEKGDLFALLLERDIILDTAESYKYLAATDWPTRKAFIRESANFENYMKPELVQSDLALLLASDEIDDAIKQTIVDKSTAYAEVAEQKALTEMARLAAQYRATIQSAVVKKMAVNGASPQHIVILLEPHLESLSREELFTVLESMGGEYGKLTQPGRTVVRISNTSADRTLLECLKTHGIVSSYKTDSSTIGVYRKHK